MSLQVWLPLNGDLNNCGLSNISIENTGVIINNNGKIGKCYQFDGNVFLSLSKGIDVTKNYSICYWFKELENNTANNFRVIYQCGNLIVGQYSNKLDIYVGTGFDVATELDTTDWNHACFTFEANTKIVKIYINGILVKQSTITLIPTSGDIATIGKRSNNTYYFQGLLNDFRIYDHTLSPKEVKEIAKGLIVHYKLDGKFTDKSIDCSGFLNNGEIVGTLTPDNSTPRYEQSCAFETSSYIKAVSPTAEAKTMACWVYIGESLPVSKVIAVDFKSKLALGFSSSSYIINTCDSNNKQIQRKVTSYIVINSWNHIVTDKENNVYINGVKIPVGTASANNWGHTSDELLVGCRCNSSGYNYFWNGKISDFRLYAAILSEDEVKELYNTAAWVAPNAMSAYELKEV